jgi:hypothetical protein
MIFRRADCLSDQDNVRLDGVLWNVASVAACVPSKSDPLGQRLAIRLTRMVGDAKDLELRPGDLVLLAI